MDNLSGSAVGWVQTETKTEQKMDKPENKKQKIPLATELKQLNALKEKLEKKYDKNQHKHLNDAITEIQNSIRSLKRVN